MPILDLSDLSVSDAALYLRAVILCPQDLTAQARLFARFRNSQTSAALSRGIRVAPWRRDQAARQLTRLDDRDSDRTIGAAAAAFMFMRVLVDGASLNSAIKELRQTYGRVPSTYWGYWDEFRPAVHLGAAFCFWGGFWLTDPPDLESFLVIAEGLRRKGETLAASPQSKRGRFLLDPAAMYRLPECVVLSDHTFVMPSAGEIQPLSDNAVSS